VIGGLSHLDESKDAVAWRSFDIHPVPGGGITWAKTSYKSIRGDIAVSWKIESGQFLMDVTIPANTWASVFVPTDDPVAVKEGGKLAGTAAGVTMGGPMQGGARLSVKAGTYHFSAPYTK
jgi:alpha-L-rhamnosidase